MRVIDLSMVVSNWDRNDFAPQETYFKLRPVVKWEDKGFVSNMVEMTVHTGTQIADVTAEGLVCAANRRRSARRFRPFAPMSGRLISTFRSHRG